VTLQGLRPGPMLFTSNPELIWGFFVGLLIGTLLATALYLVMIPWFALITLVRIELMAPMLLIITLFGAYANERNMMDVLVAILFGLFGYFARRHGYPLISLVIGLILGKLAEGSFHQALMISDHDYSVFVLRPLSAAIFAVCLLLVILPGVKKRIGHGGAEVT
jgi:putative tricarboxylic transport membrane protein